MKLQKLAGATSEIWEIFIRDSSSTTGGGLTGLTNASGSLTAYYHRNTDTTATAISLVTMTVGTFTSSGFKEIDATNMPGWYQFCPPNAALAAGAKSCSFHLKGAANMAPLPIEVQLLAVNVDDAVRMGMTALPNAAAEAAGGLYTRGTGAGQINQDANGRVDANAKAWAGTTTTLTSGLPDVNMKTITAGIIAAASFASGALDAVWSTATRVLTAGTNIQLPSNGLANITAWTVALTGNITGNLSGSVGSVTGLTASNLDATISSRLASASYTAPLDAAGTRTAVGLTSANLDTQIATLATPTNITAGTITTVTNLTNAPTSGDLTATMKASVTTAATAATPTAAAVTGAVGSVTGLTASNLDVAVSTRLASAAYTAPPTANANADALLDRTAGVETGLTVRQAFRLIASSLFGKASGLATTTAKFRDTNDTMDRITATVDTNGNRSAVTLDAS